MGVEMQRKEKLIGEGVSFERIRRITGYLVGGLDRFNDAKRAEERDRVKHTDMRRGKVEKVVVESVHVFEALRGG